MLVTYVTNPGGNGVKYVYDSLINIIKGNESVEKAEKEEIFSLYIQVQNYC
jgi:hypothetical protein